MLQIAIRTASPKEASMAEQFIFQRTLDAPRQRVWDAFTKEEHLKHWWGPSGMENVVHVFDLKPGGLHHYSMKTPTGDTWWGRWIFEEVRSRKPPTENCSTAKLPITLPMIIAVRIVRGERSPAYAR